MKKDTDITKVIFRKHKDGEIVALFPDDVWDRHLIASYGHSWQHGGADYKYVVSITKLATPEEYNSLKTELENLFGYNLKVVKKHISKR